VNLNEVTQRRLERYQEHFLEAAKDAKSAAKYNRIIIEAAVAAGIAEGVPADVGDLPPRVVKDMTTKILEHVAAAEAPVSGEA
jgi:hypothetical protein